jgi:DNA polymerase III subunit alpha
MAGKNLNVSDFVHLHNHTQYSLLDGLTKVPDLIEAVDDMGMTAVAMTDHGTMSGTIEFYKAATAAGVKPIIGMETYVAPRKHTDKDPAKDKTPYHLILLAMNNQGYKNLMKLSSIANLEGYYYRPRIDHDLLEEYKEGLIVLSGCIGGEVGDALRNNQYKTAKEIAKWYKKVFGDRYYLEIQDHGHKDHNSAWQEQVAVTEQTFEIAKELNIKCVLTCDAHYLKHADQEAHEILLCVQTGSFLNDEGRMSLKNFELHVTDPKEIIKRWGKEHPEVITNTNDIAQRCNVEIELGKILIPKFPLPRGETEKSHLRKLVYRGLAWRYGHKSQEQAAELSEAEAKQTLSIDTVARAEYELNVINEMGFNGYFLIIADFVNWGKDRGIVFGPGRGSAAGSIISYALKITELDPLKYDLLFERFLNPDRISMPDIDIDIQDSRRDEVIQYCVEKYGTERVANIVTFGRMAARNAVRDVARVLQVPYSEADRWAKMIPPPVQGRHIPLKNSLMDSQELKKEYADNADAKRVFDLAVQLEGTIRSHGVHAAGVVIAPAEIVNYVPLEMAQKGVVSTQYSMGPVDELGLLKIDFLGLSNLTIIKNALRIVKKVYKKDIDINKIPLDDSKTFKLFQRGDTTGVFQLESSGMKRYLKDLKPTVFEDIIAMVALYRPGPLTAGLTDRFIARKNGQEEVTYDHPLMKPALKSTYGVMVYQEQFMQIVKEMCGFSGGQADTLRKAVGKKNRDLMKKMKDSIIKGALQNDVDQKVAEKFWTNLEGFADYAFNKSHAACYGMIAYQTAYLKAHYPAAFMAALMTSDFDNTDRLAIEINECQHMGIEVLPPDVNESFVEFGVVPKENKIRFGMAAIKNVGSNAVEEILRAREANGKFDSLESFFTNVNSRIANRKTMESLIKAGALDRFGDRSVLLNNLEYLMSFAARTQKQLGTGQTDLFGEATQTSGLGAPKLSLIESDPTYTMGEMLQWERELLGIYLSQHPLDDYEDALLSLTNPITDLGSVPEGSTVTIGGIINSLREITTKNGQKMAFVQLADMTSEIELVVFPKVHTENEALWIRDKIVLVKGQTSRRGQNGTSGELKVLAEDAKELKPEDAKASLKSSKSIQASNNKADKSKRVYIRLPNSEDQDTLVSIKQTIDSASGETEVVLVLGSSQERQAIKLPIKIDANQANIELLEELVGEDNVKIK